MALVRFLVGTLFVLSTTMSFAMEDIVIDYDFYTEELLLSWPKDDLDYIIDVSNKTYDDCLPYYNLTDSFYVNHYEDIIKIPLALGVYKINVFYSEDGTTRSNTIFYRSLNITIGKQTNTFTWCPSTDNISYNLYYKDVPEDAYTEHFSLDQSTTEVDLQGSYFNTYFLVITTIGEVDGEEAESEYSDEIIVFIGLPPEIKEISLIN